MISLKADVDFFSDCYWTIFNEMWENGHETTGDNKVYDAHFK